MYGQTLPAQHDVGLRRLCQSDNNRISLFHSQPLPKPPAVVMHAPSTAMDSDEEEDKSYVLPRRIARAQANIHTEVAATRALATTLAAIT